MRTTVDIPDALGKMVKIRAAHEGCSPKVFMDAYLAAFAMAGGYTLVTLDTAFRNFGGLSLVIPE